MNTKDYLSRLTAAVYRELAPGELLGLARAGHPEAFAALVCRRYALVAAVCRRILGPGGPVEDVVLDVFLDLWRHRDVVKDLAALDGWLARTARRRAVRWVKREAGRRQREADRPVPPGGPDPV